MPFPRLFHRTAVLLRRATPVLAVLAALSLAACGGDDDDDGGPLGPGSDVTGTWYGGAAGGYVRIGTEEIDLYVDLGDCYFHVTYEILDVDGDTYTLNFEGMQGQIEIRRDGADLIIDDGEELIYEASDVDVDTLTICEGIGGNLEPMLGTCTSYDPLVLGVPDGGTLSTTDATDPNGYHYDAYRLELASAGTVEISETSDDIDSFLYLYSAAGVLLESNDDDGGNFDALITADLDAGCYIVVASSFGPGETGSYVIGAAEL